MTNRAKIADRRVPGRKAFVLRLVWRLFVHLSWDKKKEAAYGRPLIYPSREAISGQIANANLLQQFGR